MGDQLAAAAVRVPMIEEAEATGYLAELYERVKSETGLPFVPDMFRLLSTKPELLNSILAGYNGIFNHGKLPREIRELVAAWTSRVNQCPYCVGTHSFFMQVYGGTEELANAIAASDSPDQLPVDERTHELLRLVTKVTTAPYKITDSEWQRAQDAGWSTEELLEGVFCASLFNFITRLVDSLGLGTSVTMSRISQQEVPAEPASEADDGHQPASSS
ncbi:MAG TPA: peroxidase-related enzyme [Streptosporangiaceae bacterium]